MQSKVHLRGTLTIRTKLIVTVRVTIVGVIGLKRNERAEDSVPDPFCLVKYLDKEWGTRRRRATIVCGGLVPCRGSRCAGSRRWELRGVLSRC